MREVRVQGSDAFVIRSVSVLPESIPAGFSVLAGLEDDESLLIVDLGGTTLDVSHVRSKMTGITKTWCDPNIGVSLITSGVKEQMAVHANTRVSSFQADMNLTTFPVAFIMLNSVSLSLMLSMNGRSCLLNELMMSSAVSPTIHM